MGLARLGLAGIRDWRVWLVPPFLAGIALRGFHLEQQVLTGDELHTVNAALSLPLGTILRTWTFEGADYCVPLTAFFRLLLDHGQVLSELHFRAPVLLASAIALVAIPLALAPRIGERAALVLAWLLAVSPALVLYGRIVRSYTPVMLLAFVAVLAFAHWWRSGSRWGGAAYVASGAAAVYFHLVALPLLGAALLYAGLATLADARRRRGRVLALAGLGGAWALAVALLLLPARESLLALWGMHQGGRLPGPQAWADIARLQAGTAAPWLAAGMAALLLRGVWLGWRRHRSGMLYVGTLALGQVAGLAILSPVGLEQPLIASRYLLPLTPFLLAGVALGLASPWTQAQGTLARRLHTAGIPGFVLALVAFGPLVRPAFLESSFSHAASALEFTRAPVSVTPSQAPAFYRELMRDVGSGAVLEVPWLNVATHAFEAYQQLHDRPVKVGSVNRLHREGRVALHNTVGATPALLLGSGARYLVLHDALRWEELLVGALDADRARYLETSGVWEILDAAAHTLGRRLEAEWGPPEHSEDSIRVWDLEAVRARAGPQLTAP